MSRTSKLDFRYHTYTYMLDTTHKSEDFLLLFTSEVLYMALPSTPLPYPFPSLSYFEFFRVVLYFIHSTSTYVSQHNIQIRQHYFILLIASRLLRTFDRTCNGLYRTYMQMSTWRRTFYHQFNSIPFNSIPLRDCTLRCAVYSSS